jgi:ribosomal protein L17
MLNDEMKSLAEAIEASYEARRAALSRLKEETAQTLRDFHQEHEEMARDLKADLANETRERSKETQEFMSSLANENKERAASVRNELSSYANDRRKAHKTWDNLTKAMRAKRGG